MRACRDHRYRIRDCAACQAANPPLIRWVYDSTLSFACHPERGGHYCDDGFIVPLVGLRPQVDSDGLVTFRALQPVELLEEIVGWVEGEVT